jgi:hypothetical protein
VDDVESSYLQTCWFVASASHSAALKIALQSLAWKRGSLPCGQYACRRIVQCTAIFSVEDQTSALLSA